MAQAAVRPKVVVRLLLIYCFMHLTLFVGNLCSSLFCSAFFCDLSSFSIILVRRRKLVVYFKCLPGVLRLLVFCGSSSRYVGWSEVCDCGIS